MKRLLPLVAFLAAVIPSLASARAMTVHVSGTLPTTGAQMNMLRRPSARWIHAQGQQPIGNNPSLLSINGVPLDGTYTNTDYAVSFRYPTSWERQDLMQKEGTLTLAVMFLSAPERTADDLRQNVNLVVENLSDPLTLDQYTTMGMQSEQALFQDYALVRSDRSSVGGLLPARTVIFTATSTGRAMTFEQTWAVIGSRAYVWTFADDSKAFPMHVATFERMLDSVILR